MPHHTPLIGTIVAGLVVAFLMGALAHKLKVSPLVGYLLAGVIVGPFTPGYVANASIANELAEIGVILLMFGVGLHFSLRDLLSVRSIAIPGALGQIAVATLLGMGLASLFGWGLMSGIVFGLALSVASTVVLLRALEAHNIVQTHRGRIAVGWLIVEDVVMVLALVLLPVLARVMNEASGAGIEAIVQPLATTAVKIAGFMALMLLVARKLIPVALHWVVHTGSRELFRLAVLAIALGVAFGAALAFDVSFALGAFFAGMILGETPLSRQATVETLPLRDAFAVLFFVSVGMLFNPMIVVEHPLPLLGTVAIILLGKSLAAYVIVRVFGHDNRTALTVAASLAQIGEFSFILVTLGTGLGVLPGEGRDLILAGAIISIFLNPFIFSLIANRHHQAASMQPEPVVPRTTKGHIILIGYGRIGSRIAAELQRSKQPFVIIEDQQDIAAQATRDGHKVVQGNALDTRTLEAAGIEQAGRLLIAIPEGFEGGAIVERVNTLSPDLEVIARAHSDAEAAHLIKLGVREVVTGERAISSRMLSLASRPVIGGANA